MAGMERVAVWALMSGSGSSKDVFTVRARFKGDGGGLLLGVLPRVRACCGTGGCVGAVERQRQRPRWGAAGCVGCVRGGAWLVWALVSAVGAVAASKRGCCWV